MKFSSSIRVREEEVDGCGPWYWPKTDSGAWDGPVDDWNKSHKEKYFRNIKNRRVAVQAGGNCGLYPRLLGQYFQQVYTFEPDPFNFYCLTLNTADSENIVRMQAALGSNHNKVSVKRLTDTNVGMHRVYEDSVSGSVPQLMIDDLNLEICDFIQLDIELYEINALLGAKETILRCKPTIAVENRTPEIDEFMKEVGMKFIEQSVMDSIFSY